MTELRIEATTFRDHPARRLVAGDLEAVFLPSLGMLCASFTHRGEELLGRTDELERYVQQGATLGIPLLHPWANRLGGFFYEAVGRRVVLDRDSSLLHYDAAGLPMHGVPGARLDCRILGEESDASGITLAARLDWSGIERLMVFPFPHWLDTRARLDEAGLTIETTVTPRGDVPVPLSFGYHPYVRLAGVPRAEWILELPQLRHLALDERKIPNGVEELWTWNAGPLGDASFDDAFRILLPRPEFSIRAGGRRITFSFLEGYPFTQIYAPRDRDFIAIEPMTAPGNALISGHGLRSVAPGSTFRAAFRIGV
jgi:aldose 1-epimerase